jgi:hypothetical protein
VLATRAKVILQESTSLSPPRRIVVGAAGVRGRKSSLRDGASVNGRGVCLEKDGGGAEGLPCIAIDETTARRYHLPAGKLVVAVAGSARGEVQPMEEDVSLKGMAGERVGASQGD